MTKTITTWKGKHRFTSTLGHNQLEIDGSRKDGFGPKALLLSAVAGCSGIDIVDILEKMRVPFSDFEISVEAGQTEEHPRVYTDLYITYRLHTDPANEEKVRKAINLSLDKYCGVSAMLRKNAPIHYTLEIV